MTAALPPYESLRLAILQRYRILDTAPDEAFDRVARLVAQLLEVPIAAVGLIDAERLWFKARVGIGSEEIPREEAFCAHTILSDDLLVVEDARLDQRFRDNPFVTGEAGLRF